MNIMIASDIHGSAKYCKMMLKAFKAEKPDKILLLGDLLYHGPRNALPGEYDTKAVAEMLNGLKGSVMCVRGNCDAEVDLVMLEFPIMAEYCLLSVGKRTIFATHGHIYSKENFPEADILLHGHTHIPAWEELGGGRLYVNPGSVSIPKAGSKHSYMMLNNDGMVWKDVESRKEYHTLSFR